MNRLTERLRVLVCMVGREVRHLRTTDTRLFTEPLTIEVLRTLESDIALTECIEVFVRCFGRLQDTIGDKLLQTYRSFSGKRWALRSTTSIAQNAWAS